jgi:hypothetical protein
MLIHGKCHCGNVAFSLTWEPDPIEIPARACTCSFCTAHGAVWTSNPQGALEIVVDDPARVSRYVFGTETAEFLICSRCGVVPACVSVAEGRLHAVVNINTFDNVDQALFKHGVVSFDGEDATSRIARRQRYWIGDVTYTENNPKDLARNPTRPAG